jgi:hypothetical protein
MPNHIHVLAPCASTAAAKRKLARQVRYIVLNPCRDRIVGDPLSWMWSTQRDVMGATVQPWVTRDASYSG